MGALAQIRCVFLGALLVTLAKGLHTRSCRCKSQCFRAASLWSSSCSGAIANAHPVIDEPDTGATVLRGAMPRLLTGTFGDRCNSYTKRFMYALRIAHHCSSDVVRALDCIKDETSPVFICLSLPYSAGSACRTAIDEGCEELTPKCCRCKTLTEMSNNQSGCLLQIYQGDPCGDDCNLLDYSDGRYPQSGWFWFGKDNYKFHGTCEQAKEENDVFAPHVMCPEPV